LFFGFKPVQVQAERLLVMGDSLSAAYGMPTEMGWVGLLQQKFDAHNKEIQVINASLSGETTSGGLQRLPKLLALHQPKWVIIELGANDALRGQDLRQTQRNIQKMIELSKNIGAEVMLLGIRLPTNYGPAYDAQLGRVYTNLSKRFSIPLDPFFLESVALEPDLMQDDALHPNEQAQPLILERLWPQVMEWMSLPSDP
jgi:acyl-CoA thioesterase-1